MKNAETNQSVPFNYKKHRKLGKFFILFIFICLFSSIVLISSALSNLLSIKNWGVFVSSTEIPTVNLYCVSYGSFETEKLALVESAVIKEKGGAGYIYKNNSKFTVLLSGYLDKSVCEKVIKKNSEILDNLTLVEINLPKIKIQHNKAANISALTEICNIQLNTFKTLQEISNLLDSGEISSSQAYNKLFNLSYQIDRTIKDFESESLLTSQENYKLLLVNAKNIYYKVNNLILHTAKKDISVEIKYCALDIMFINNAS